MKFDECGFRNSIIPKKHRQKYKRHVFIISVTYRCIVLWDRLELSLNVQFRVVRKLKYTDFIINSKIKNWILFFYNLMWFRSLYDFYLSIIIIINYRQQSRNKQIEVVKKKSTYHLKIYQCHLQIKRFMRQVLRNRRTN